MITIRMVRKSPLRLQIREKLTTFIIYDFYHLSNGDVRIVNTRNGQDIIIEGGSALTKDYLQSIIRDIQMSR